MSPEILGLVSLAALFIGIFIGFPISFTLIFLGIVFGFIGIGKVVFYLMVLQFFGVMREPLLAAVPLFLFMGYILEQAGLMDRLFVGFRLMLAGIKGSLYIAVMTTATLFAAATGIVGASVTLLGVMAAPIMMNALLQSDFRNHDLILFDTNLINSFDRPHGVPSSDCSIPKAEVGSPKRNQNILFEI